MENQTPIDVNSQSQPQPVDLPPVSQPVVPPVQEVKPTVYEKPRNSFLVVLLSILLSISILIAGYFAYQTQNLVKELQTIKKVSPTPEDIINVPSQTPIATENPSVEPTMSPVPVASVSSSASPTSTSN